MADTKTVSRSLRMTQFQAITLCIALLSLGMSLWQLSVPEMLSAYDSGVYLAASVHLMSGVFPYKDFTFVQPPGILMLMSPVAVFSRIVGTHDGLILARVVSSLVTAANAGLVAWIVRHRGRLAMVIAGGGLAFLPVSFFVSSSLTLEPYCILFVLLGTLCVLDTDVAGDLLSTRRLVGGGILFGVAGLIKLWAIFPLVALVICLVPRYRLRVRTLIAVAAATFVVACLPFYLAAPRSFISQVFTEQLFRQATAFQGASIGYRFMVMTGFGPTTIEPSPRTAEIAFALVLCLVVVVFTFRRRREKLDAYFILSSIFVGAALLVSPEFFPYYGYFLEPFLLCLLGVSLSSLAATLGPRLAAVPMSRMFRRALRRITEGVGAVFIFALVLYVTSFYSAYAWGLGLYEPTFAAITNRIPEGSCVVYTGVFDGLVANRWTSNDPHCPTQVDPLGMWMAWGYQTKAAAPAFAAEWMTYFEKASYAVLNSPGDSLVGWSPTLLTWFSNHFRLVYHHNYVFIYQSDATS